MKRKLTYYDRLVALAFHPQYHREHKKLFPSSPLPLGIIFSPGNEIEKFKRRWGLEFIVDPNDVERRLGNGLKKNIEGGIFSDYHEQVKVIPHQEIFHGDHLKPQLALRDDKYLTLQIDVTADETKLLADVKDYIKFYRRLIKFQPTRRAKPSQVDHWLIYKKRHVERQSLLRIAKDLAGKNENPAYNEVVNAKHKQVIRAYQKAKQIISQIRPAE